MITTWKEAIGAEKEQAYFQDTLQQVRLERAQGKIIYPAEQDVFNAFKITEFADVKVVILGQDPYHGADQAHGLAFSVQKHIDIPPSLKNIYKELADDVAGFHIPEHGCLQKWAEQGVLLLNTVLTVRAGQAHSHAHLGWEMFTDRVIHALAHHKQHLVFILWGSHAQKKGAFIDRSRHLVLTSAHPSPLSAYRGFFGSKPFSKTNQYLQQHGIQTIDWQL